MTITKTRTLILNPNSNHFGINGDNAFLAGQDIVDEFKLNTNKLKEHKDIDAHFKSEFRRWPIGHKPYIMFENMMDGFIHLSASPMSAPNSSLDTNRTKVFLFNLLSRDLISAEAYRQCFKKPERLSRKVTLGKPENLKLYDLK